MSKDRHKKSSLWNGVRDGVWPTPVRLGPNTAVWPEHEIDEVLKARIAGASVEEVRALVQRLHEARQVGGVTAADPLVVIDDRLDESRLQYARQRAAIGFPGNGSVTLRTRFVTPM